jgi:2-oxoglutarate ferredoxin oxidoreductase subunit alpha
MKTEIKDHVVIKFAGDSGDGMQLTGNQFTNNSALFGNDIATFPDFPAEIRAPAGTLAGVSGFQLHFGSTEIDTPGDFCDVLVAMNVAALKLNLRYLKPNGLIIVDESGFDSKNMKLAKVAAEQNPLTDGSLSNYSLKIFDFSKLTHECLKDSGLTGKSIDRSKNMFVLGFVYWLYHRDLTSTISYITERFAKDELLLNANITTLKAGYAFGETTESMTERYEVAPAKLAQGQYRNMMGNQATALGLVAASVKSGLSLFYGSYPITPASDILHDLSKQKHFGVKTFQAEDEIAAVCSAIGASFGGALGVTGTSGPGLPLKSEAISLAVSLELPLVVIDVQRAGPSTGMPTKTEQSDLLIAMYGRHGEAPLPVLAAKSPSDCFDTVFEACRIALQHMTPVIFLSDGYIANGSEPWQFPTEENLPTINVKFAEKKETPFYPYQRDENLVRNWAIPGTAGLEHRIGGIEKEDLTGNISYDPANHEKMVKIRAAKVKKIEEDIPELALEFGDENDDVLLLGWGSSYGAIRSAVKQLRAEGFKVAQAHLRYINPMPKNTEQLLRKFKKVIVPEKNNGQLVKLIREQFLIDAISYTKVQGLPFTQYDIVQQVKNLH